MAPRIIDKEKKKKQILLAAMTVFAKKGVKNSRMVDIAQQAGIGKGTIYEYFRNRDEILVEAFYLVMGEMEAKLKSVLDDTKNPEEKVRAMIQLAYDTLSQFTADFIEIFVDFWSEGIRHRGKDENLAINLQAIYAKYRQQLSEVLSEGTTKGHFRQMDTSAVASALMAITDGLLLQLILDRQAFDQSSVIDEALNMILHGIKNRTA